VFCIIASLVLHDSAQPVLGADLVPFTTREDSSDLGSTWDLEGPIEPGDERKLAGALQMRDTLRGWLTIRPNAPSIRTFSDGGDIETALKLGQMIRNAGFGVIVPDQGFCRSACVFLLVAAVTRFVTGDVSIHRPYFTRLDPNLPPQQVDARYKMLTRGIYDFLSEMNVPTALADAMFAVPPTQAHRLSHTELSKYLLNQHDPAYDERMVAQDAARFNISAIDYRSRKATAARECPIDWSRVGDLNDPINLRRFGDVLEENTICEASILANISLPEARSRYYRLKDVRQSIPFGKERDCYAAIIVNNVMPADDPRCHK
jgi:hypothetical protein